MNKQKTGLIATIPMFAIIVLGLAYGQQIQAQDEPFVASTEYADFLDSQVEQRTLTIKDWRSTARLTLGLTLSMGILGIVVSALQVHKNPKVATVVLGVTISCLTLIKTEVFKIDYHTYQQAISKAEFYIEEAEWKMAQARSARNEEEWGALVDGVSLKMKAVDGIGIELLAGDSSFPALDLEPALQAVAVEPTALDRTVGAVLAATSLFAGSAEAADANPGWIAKAPLARDAIFFVGHATNKSLKQGGEESRKAAQQEAEKFFTELADRTLKGRKSAIDAKALANYLLKSAEVSNTHYTREPANLYGHHTLLRLSRKSLVTDLMFFGIKRRTQVPASVVKAVEKARMPAAAS